MTRFLVATILSLFFMACGNKNPKPVPGQISYDARIGTGNFSKVVIGENVDETMADRGSKIYVVKCFACHKLTEEKLVGPGWKGITTRVTAEWILNYITNTDQMLNIDPEAQKQLKIFGSRMPNQNLSDQDARDLYEFMRKNDRSK
jgi:cytochrome c